MPQGVTRLMVHAQRSGSAHQGPDRLRPCTPAVWLRAVPQAIFST